MKTNFAYLFILITALAACTGEKPAYRIGVSQCSGGNWRIQLNQEMLAAQHLYEQHVKVDIVNCYDQSDVQVRQIDSLVASGIDLLVAAPNEYAEISPALKRAKESGVPVILFDRKANTDDYTAFIGGDNEAVGRLAANYAAQLAAQTAGRRVLEVTALQNTSPSRDRHRGFMAAMAAHPEVNYQYLYGDWDDHHTDSLVRVALRSDHRPDVVFCHSDFMARGASWAVDSLGLSGQVKIIGVDGLSGPNEGIEAVQQGLFAGTCVYPTHGEKIVRLALDILEGKPYKRDNVLQSMLVTPENVEMVALYSNELKAQSTDLVVIQDKLEQYFGLYNMQHKVIWAAVVAIVLLVAGLIMTWRARVQIRRAHRRQKLLNQEQTLFYTNASHQLKTPLTLIAGPIRQMVANGNVAGDDRTLLDIADKNLQQLEMVVTDVLNFRNDKGGAAVSDATAARIADNARQQAGEQVRDEHLNMLKQDDTDELPNILIIDDNDDMRRYLRTLLSSRFYVYEAPDGQSGLQLARETVPDIIVSDVMMPVIDGLQLCRLLKDNFITSHIPVILLTARSTEQQQMEGYEHGADAYLTKPFRADLLISRIDNLLRNRRQLRTHFNGQQPGEQQPKLTTQDRLFMDQLKEIVRQNMGNADLKVDDLGHQLGISRVQLYRKVKVLTGTSPVDLLRQMRLERARILLSTTTKTVAEIAYEVGFGNPSYFATCFKKQFGRLPNEMRTV